MYVEGRLQVREYEDKEGNARTSVEVVASKVRFLGRENNHGEEKRPVPGQPKAKGGSRWLRRTTSIRAGMILRFKTGFRESVHFGDGFCSFSWFLAFICSDARIA